VSRWRARSDGRNRPVDPARGVLGATWAWLTFGLLLVAVGSLVAFGRLAPALVLDLLALWPLPALALVLLPVTFRRRHRSPVLATVVPLLTLTWLLAGLGWFLVDEVPDAPSRAADIVGPDVRPATARMAIEVDGHLVVGVTSGSIYRLGTSRMGGAVGPPDVYEAEDVDLFVAVALPRVDAGWYRSEGWTLGLRAGPVWELGLSAAVVDADLRPLDVVSMTIRADGIVWVAAGERELTVVGGTLTIVLPAGQPGGVDGEARVPDGWVATDGGWVSPLGPDGPTVVVAGGDVTIVEGSP
jgi:hypothetical protein